MQAFRPFLPLILGTALAVACEVAVMWAGLAPWWLLPAVLPAVAGFVGTVILEMRYRGV
jgi:hypothetical protein